MRALIALVLGLTFTAVPLLAQAESRALPLEESALALVAKETIAASGSSVTGGPFADPAEIVSVDYDSSSGPGPITVNFTYSDTAAGPFTSGTDSNSSGYMNAVTFNTTPTSGANVKLFPYKFFKAGVSNAAATAFALTRVTANRRGQGRSFRPYALVHETVPVDSLKAAVVANAGTSAAGPTNPLVNAAEFVSFFWDGTGNNTATKKCQFRYSNAPGGPFVAWEAQGGAAYQNEVTQNNADGGANCMPFPALYFKVQVNNASGASFTVNTVSLTRKSQQKR